MFSLIFLRVCILALTLAKCVSASGAGFILRDKSFTIKSTISSLDNGLNIPRLAHLSESYSSELRRARLDYELRDTKVYEEFYYDPRVGSGVSLSKTFKSCSRTPLNVLYYNLYLNSNEVKNLFKIADESIENLNYIVGPSKLLFLIANQADKFQASLDPNTDKDQQVIARGHPFIQYKLELELDSNKKAVLSIAYDKITHSEQSIRDTVPLQVYITFPDSKVFLIIDYYSVETFPNTKIHPRFDLAMKNELIMEDQFNYPTSYECSEIIEADDLKGDLFEQYDLSSVRFSFEATSKPLLGRLIKHFVAYDGMTASLRIDTRRRTLSEKDNNRDYVQILDFRTNRKYTYVEKPTFKGNISEESEFFFTLSGDKKSQCSVVYANDPDKSTRDSWKLSKFLTGVEEFTFMGYGQVRGVNARIYEGKSDSLPYWFSQPMAFKDKDNNYRYKMLGDIIKENPSRQQKSEYNVVFYIRDDNEEKDEGTGIKPLLIDYYDLRIDKSSDFRRSLVIRINDFIWDLTESPNGDNPTDLFSLKDHCSTGSGFDKYAEVDLLLREDTSKTQTELRDTNVDWVFNSILRNGALVSSIRDVMDIQSVMMYDLQSKVVEFDSKNKIMASFRVAEHPRAVYQLTFIGNARLNRNHIDKMLIVDALTIAECLWLVGEYRKPIYMYYSQLSSSCIFDTELSESSSSDIRDSNVFKMMDTEVGELYRIESNFDRDTCLSNSWLRDGKFTHLDNREMILQTNEQGNPIQPLNLNDLKMRIARVKINNVNFMNEIAEGNEQRQIKPAMRVYSGFMLPINDGDQQTKVYKLKTNNEDMSQEQCHAACLADLNCKSFSYCVQLPNTVCTLSTVSFEGPGIREHLESREAQNLARGSKLMIKTMYFTIELIRDFRCELHNKIHIDLFERAKAGMFPLRNLIIFPVQNEETCAKMCFTKSLESITSSIGLGKQIRKLLLEQDDDGENSSQLIKQIHDQYSDATSKFCKFFLYLDTTLSSEEQSILDQAVEESYKTIESSKYCAFEGETNRKLDEKFQSFQLLFNNYRFRFKLLYEKRYGYGLKRSVSPEVEEAYQNVVQQKGLEKGQYEILKNSLSEGKNFQKELQDDADICAYECFFQHSGLWPACRSFDNVIFSFDYPSSTSSYGICHLNTETDSREKFSVSNLESESIQIWHYMPRFGNILEEGDDYFDLSTLNEKIDRSKTDQMRPNGIGGVFKVIFNICVTILLLSLGIFTGFYAGCKLTERLVEAKFGGRIPDRVPLSPI